MRSRSGSRSRSRHHDTSQPLHTDPSDVPPGDLSPTDAPPGDLPQRDDDTDEPERRNAPMTFGQRHGLKVMGVVMAALFATVVIAQVAC